MKKISNISTLALIGSLGAIPMAQAQDGGSAIEEVVVTGSRVVTDGSQAPTPVTTMTAEDLTMSAPSNLPDALNKLPQFTGSSSQTSGGTFNSNQEPLGNYLNLRGLGKGRVLTMLNGQRLAPTLGTSNAVDANIIPQMLVKRVDIVTGGASAVYGSDAVSGVVNFVLDDKFEGIKVDLNTGASSRGDNESYKASIAGGFALGDSTHVILAAEVYNNDGVPSIYDRDWVTGRPQLATSGAGTAASPLRTSEVAQPWLGFGVGRNPGNFFGATFADDGSLLNPPFPSELNATFGNRDSGGTSIAGTLETQRLFGNVSFDVTENIKGHVTGIYSTSDTSFNSSTNNTTNGQYARAMRVFGDNPYLNASAKTQLGLTDNTYTWLNGLYNDIGVVTNLTENEYSSIQLGLNGDINDNWSWDVNYTWGEAKQSAIFNEFKMKEVWAAMDAVVDPASGNVVCGVTLRNPGFMDDCRPLNLMGQYNFTQEARDYVRGDSIKDTTNTMEYFNFNVVGELMQLAGGPLTLAFGGEYRTQDLAMVSNADPTFYINSDGTNNYAKFINDHMGIRGIDESSLQALADYESGSITEAELNAALNTGTVPGFEANRYSSINDGGAAGSQTVNEFYAEANAPITDTFSVSLAARSTDYETSGQSTTWKAGMSWNPTESVRVRATKSRDIAAPNLSLLFAARDPFFGDLLDIHIDGTPAEQNIPTILYVRSGNENLNPETADTTSFGLVYQPESVPGLTMSADWYQIKIQDAFGTLDQNNMLRECEASNGESVLCDYIKRPLPFSDRTQANKATEVSLVPFNLALLETSGIDFELGYTFDALGGTVGLRGFVNYVDTFTTQASEKDDAVEHAGYEIALLGGNTSLPKWKGMLMQTYSQGAFSAMLSERFTGKYTLGSEGQVWASDEANIPGGKVDNEIYVDLNLGYNFGDNEQYHAYFNVQNLTDITPPSLPGSNAPNIGVFTDRTTFDVIGRSFTLGLRADF